jgi:hypothetical protein
MVKDNFKLKLRVSFTTKNGGLMCYKSARALPLLWSRERWDVESSFRELTESLSLEQWHSFDKNGLLQEFFTRMWLFNFTKIQIFFRSKKHKRENGGTYYRTNFKLCCEWIVRKFPLLLKRKLTIFKEIDELIRISTEKRKRYSRSFEREIKRPASKYKYNNTVWLVEVYY